MAGPFNNLFDPNAAAPANPAANADFGASAGIPLIAAALSNPNSATPVSPALNQSIPNNIRSGSTFTPSTAAAQAYVNAAKDLPDYNAYHPSNLRKVAAVLAGLGTVRPAGMWGGNPVGMVANPSEAFNTASNVLLAPYQRQLAGSEAKLKPLQAAAQLEMEQNNQARMMEALDERTAHNQVMEGQGQQRLNDMKPYYQARADYYNNQGTIQTDTNGNAVMVYKNGRQVPLNGIASSYQVHEWETQKKTMDDFNNNIALAKKRGEIDLANKLTEQLAGYKQALGLIQARTESQEAVKQTPGPETTTTVTSTDQSGKPIGSATSTRTQTKPKVKSNAPIKMIAPDGTSHLINPAMMDKFIKAGWKQGTE